MGGWQRTARTEPGPPGDEVKAAGCAGAGAQVWQEEPEEVLAAGV